MSVDAERLVAAMRVLTREAHLTGPDDLPALVSGACRKLGVERAAVYVIDYDQVLLVPLTEGEAAVPPVPVEGTLAGRAYTTIGQQVTTGDSPTIWAPLLDGTERLGVLELELTCPEQIDESMRQAVLDISSLVAELVATRSAYGDGIERARRRVPLTTPAELQWRLLPALTFVAPRAAIAGGLLPTSSIAGDSFDYALNRNVLHVTIVDAMGHGLEATLLAALAISALRNARRNGLNLQEMVSAADAQIAAQFGPDKFVTATVAELDTDTGVWTWATCGHPPALLVRAGKVVKTLDQVVEPPLGLGLLGHAPDVHSERLQPGDRILLYSDGVVEARNDVGEFFGAERLVDLVTREAAAGLPAAETLRRLNLAVLAHQEGALQDDATTVLVEWLVDEARRSSPSIRG